MQITSSTAKFYVTTYIPPHVAEKPQELSYMEKLELLRKQVQLHWHRISGYATHRDPDDYSFLNDAKYEKLGWLGLSISNFSDIEWRAIQRFVNSRKDRVWKSNRRAIEGEQLWIIGEVQGDPEISVWFRFERDLKDFDRLLSSFVRPICFITPNEPNQQCVKLLKRLNHRIVRGEEQSAISVEDDEKGNSLAVRLCL